MSSITVLRPDAPDSATRDPLAPAPRRSLAGARLALINNGKPRGRELLEAIGVGLVATYGVASVDLITKPGASHRITDAEGAELRSRADVFLTGLGDCAGCSAYSLMDALVMERLGRPATVVVSDPFASRVASYARRLGAPGFPVVVVPHPVASRSHEDLLDVARRSVEAVARLLGGESA